MTRAAVAEALGRALKVYQQLRTRAPRDRRLLILTYHRVVAAPDPMLAGEVEGAAFDEQMGLLAREFEPLPLPEATTLLRDGKLPHRAVCVTFDDGYATNLSVALPTLQRWRIPATVFIASGFLNGGRMWNDTIIETARRLPEGRVDLGELGLAARVVRSIADRRTLMRDVISALKYAKPEARQRLTKQFEAMSPEPLPTDLMLTDAGVAELHAGGVDIGAHTITHPILAAIDPEQALTEICESRRRLERKVGAPVQSFAYPNGRPGVDYGPPHVEMVRAAGYRCAVSTATGAATAASDPYQLPRVSAWRATGAQFRFMLMRAFCQGPIASAHNGGA